MKKLATKSKHKSENKKIRIYGEEEKEEEENATIKFLL